MSDHGRDLSHSDTLLAGVSPTTTAVSLRTRCGVFLLGCLAVSGVTVIDLPVARAAQKREYPRIISEVLDNAEPFGHGIGVVFVVITITVLDAPRRRWAPVYLAGSALAGGLGANVAKLIIARTRPRSLSDIDTATLADTFQGWFRLGAGGSGMQSFPSAHTATAMAFAVALSTVYPQGRWWFYTLAGLVGLHRIEVSAHYPSDVCAGALIGWLAGQISIDIARRLGKRVSNTEAAATDPLT